jgi:hypothetical protein
MPAPPAENIRTAGDRVRPGLSEHEMLNPSNGDPLRPNPKKDPEAFSRWEKSVSRPVNIVDPRSCRYRRIF